MGDGMLSLSWNNHSTTFCHTLESLREKERYTDVTVACGGKFYPVHKLVLSTCSEYFETMFEQTPCKHPVIVLRDIQCNELEALLNYMYAGIVSVAQSDLARLIKVAEFLQIKGLAVPDEPPSKNSDSVRDTQKSSGKEGSQSSSKQSHNYGTVRNNPYPKVKPNDRVRPNQKYGRSENGDSLPPETSSSFKGSHTKLKGISSQNETDWQQELLTWTEDQQRSDSEIGASSSSQQSLQNCSPSEDQALATDITIKEEVMDSERMIDHEGSGGESEGGGTFSGDSGVLGSIGEDFSGAPGVIGTKDSGTSDSGKQSFASSMVSQASFNEESGPESIATGDPQFWMLGDDTGDRFPHAKGNVDESSQDFSHLLNQHPHQMVGLMNSSNDRMAGIDAATPWTDPATGDTLYQCPYCQLRLAKSAIKDHINTHKMDKPFVCPYCPFRCSQRSGLKTHIRTHTGEKPYCCPICPSRFTVNCNLKTHMRIHTGEKPFSCPHCPYRCAHKSDLNKHLYTHPVQ